MPLSRVKQLHVNVLYCGLGVLFGTGQLKFMASSLGKAVFLPCFGFQEAVPMCFQHVGFVVGSDITTHIHIRHHHTPHTAPGLHPPFVDSQTGPGNENRSASHQDRNSSSRRNDAGQAANVRGFTSHHRGKSC